MFLQNNPCEKNITKQILQKNTTCMIDTMTQKNNKLMDTAYNSTSSSKAMRYSQLLRQPKNSYCFKK